MQTNTIEGGPLGAPEGFLDDRRLRRAVGRGERGPSSCRRARRSRYNRKRCIDIVFEHLAEQHRHESLASTVAVGGGVKRLAPPVPALGQDALDLGPGRDAEERIDAVHTCHGTVALFDGRLGQVKGDEARRTGGVDRHARAAHLHKVGHVADGERRRR